MTCLNVIVNVDATLFFERNVCSLVFYGVA